MKQQVMVELSSLAPTPVMLPSPTSIRGWVGGLHEHKGVTNAWQEMGYTFKRRNETYQEALLPPCTVTHLYNEHAVTVRHLRMGF